MTLPATADPDYSSTKILSEGKSIPRGRQTGRRKNRPSRSVSPSSQAAGVLFRMSQGAIIESICVGRFGTSGPVSLAGHPLPPPTRDYGFAYVTRERIRSEEPIKSNGEGLLRSPDRYDDEFELKDRNNPPPTPSASGRGRGRRAGHPPTPRMCISCGATKTPYWREAWSNTVLLCNACGLRFSKFRRRCFDCSYVPRKEDKGSKSCTKCSGPWS